MNDGPTTTPEQAGQDSSPDEVRQRSHELVDQLQESELWRVHMFLRAIIECDPLLSNLATAPYDDEPLTEEEMAKIQEGLEAAERGELHSLEDVERRLGLRRSTAADPRARDLQFTDDSLAVSLNDGRRISVPLAWYPRLRDVTPEQRENWRLIGRGESIHWPDVDEYMSVEGLLEGTPAPEYRKTITASDFTE